MAKGLYLNGDGFAVVDYGTTARMDVDRERYEEAGHEPPFDQLPSKEEYEAARAGEDSEDEDQDDSDEDDSDEDYSNEVICDKCGETFLDTEEGVAIGPDFAFCPKCAEPGVYR